MKEKKIKHIRSNTPVAKLLYSMFPLDAIYELCMLGMAADSSCRKVEGKPDEITWEEALAIPPDLPSLSKENIQKFQKAVVEIEMKQKMKTGDYSNDLEGLTETERYAVWYLGTRWYRD